jgi:hypothetical protein
VTYTNESSRFRKVAMYEKLAPVPNSIKPTVEQATDLHEDKIKKK